jgi:hypothetical protein
MPASDRTWIIDGDPFTVDPDELPIELHRCAMVLERIGGVVIVAAQRQEIAEGHYVTTGYAFRWSSYAPAQRLSTEDNGHEPITEEALDG